MLSHQQILHFRTFGYVTLRGLLSRAEADTLRQEVTGALADAFGQLATEPNDLGGISGDYLPLAASRAPFSLSLIADGPRTFQSSAELLGGPTCRRPGSPPALPAIPPGMPARDLTSAASPSGRTSNPARPAQARFASSPALTCPASSAGSASTAPPSPPPPASGTGSGRTSWWRPSRATWSPSMPT
jgi:hypothetical protein